MNQFVATIIKTSTHKKKKTNPILAFLRRKKIGKDTKKSVLFLHGKNFTNKSKAYKRVYFPVD